MTIRSPLWEEGGCLVGLALVGVALCHTMSSSSSVEQVSSRPRPRPHHSRQDIAHQGQSAVDKLSKSLKQSHVIGHVIPPSSY